MIEATTRDGRTHRLPDDTAGYFRALDPCELAPGIGNRAMQTAEAVSEDLSLPWPVTHFLVLPTTAGDPESFGPVKVDAAHTWGWTWPTMKRPCIFVRADLSADQLERVVAHELRHLWQHWQGWASRSGTECEADAFAYDEQWMEGRR